MFHKSISSLERPHWGLVGTFVSAGAVLLTIAYFTDTYAQAVLISLGSSLLLFSLLTYVEPRLVKRLGSSLRLTSLADVQAALKSEFEHAAWRSEGFAPSLTAPSHSASITRHMVKITRQLVNSGFVSCDQPQDAECLVFRDRGDLDIKWVMSWAKDRLDLQLESPFLKDSWSRPIDGDMDNMHLHKCLVDLEDHVALVMRRLALRLSDRDMNSSLSHDRGGLIFRRAR